MRQEKILAACLMDADEAASQSRRTTRRKAIVAAVAFETAVLIGLILWPVLAPGSPPGEVVVLPRFLSPSIKPPRAQPEPPAARTQEPRIFSHPIFAPPLIPTHIPPGNPKSSENIAPPVIGSEPEGLPQGFEGIPGGLERGNWTIPPPRPKAPRIVHQSEIIQTGMLVHRVLPIYPPIAIAARISGTVELRAIIARDGSVSSVEILSGNLLLARAAEDAVWQWRYRPTILDGEAVKVETRITVRFVLGN